jgi:hypothetical protein
MLDVDMAILLVVKGVMFGLTNGFCVDGNGGVLWT